MDDERLDFELLVSPQQMLVELSCLLCIDRLDSLCEAIRQRIRELGLAEEARKIDAEEWLRAEATPEPRVVQVVLFQGRSPTPPRDGTIEWQGNFFERGFRMEAATGAIDYRERNAEDAVEENQFLARLIAPQEGHDGIDVFGAQVKAEPAKAAKLIVGSNVECRGDNFYYATKNGRVRWAADCLVVDDVLHVKGDVGLETGNIHHTGSILVTGDVQDGTTIDVDGDLEVKGLLGASNVNVGGDLVVGGGIWGATDCRVAVAGDVRAKYILESNVEAGGDVVVQNEIIQCNIGAGGSVLIPKGRIVGGTVTARGGVTASTVGNAAEVKTTIIRSVDPEPAERQEYAEEDSSVVGECLAVVRTKVHANTFFTMSSRPLRVAEEQRGPLRVMRQQGAVEIQR